MINENDGMDQRDIDKILALGSATIYEAQGAYGALDAGIKPVSAEMKIFGPALTIDMRPGDNLMIHYALLQAKAGDVLVIDCKGFTEAGVWGDVLTAQAVKTGLAGIIVHGAVRDAEAIITTGFPVFCRGLSIKGTGKAQPGKVNVPVVIGDCLIKPGDFIIGDMDGVVVVEQDNLSNALSLATQREDKETRFKTQIDQGATTADLMKLHDIFRQYNL
ncbi:MAG: 4-carboxy-4-hydroxy-2-oxoadipate aldolase/oxaloacetate decarboxylase [Enterobacterales bacterium endosymbiont of Blomia tropicalis]|uniref:4-carboxy-4-hydroxy-2-oxoadipate aldolase/oxaloacetate decarboxylase n=1 Tax=Mixta mediterraneensis TaxID=2758443 RepID=UPI0025A83D44|nr:4-carboxy-4-hydroxy-2-oxoadipate aldolase/oxaloacetate decarboxylase [Mixta mediterraneensis]MDL4915551.1 4-carboxy-4-hydroxy-2-oxoadipate aldolase/oxaloacetate decarboxylase [Mixta mediterraneensis]